MVKESATIYFISGDGSVLFFWVLMALAAFGIGCAILDGFFKYNIPNTPKSTKRFVSFGIGVAAVVFFLLTSVSTLDFGN